MKSSRRYQAHQPAPDTVPVWMAIALVLLILGTVILVPIFGPDRTPR